MRTDDSKTSTNHSTAPQKPFFGATPNHAFFSTERAQPTPFFQPQAVSPATIQAKSGDVSEEEVQRMPAFDSEVTSNGEVQRRQINSPQHTSAFPIQAKLTIGESGDKYEQEADRVASQVVEQINAPAPAQSTQGQTVQRQEENKEELQAKPEITAIQRMEESEEELQAKSNLQHQEAIRGGEASTDLTSAINSARGGGQPLDTGLQRSIGQAMGADFSGVRVHTDTQSDQLNRSIQAKAFTTGQDVFFRQGEYNPGSREGQELIAHELTHVVQQDSRKSSFVQKKPSSPTPTKRIEVDLSSQNLHAFEKGKEVYSFNCVSGDSSHPTPTGTFSILRKHPTYTSKKYGAPMNYAMFFTKTGEAIHQGVAVGPLSYLKSWGVDSIGSHGCVRLAKDNAATLFLWTPKGTPVWVH